MPLRRKTVAPRSEFEVLNERISNLEKAIKPLQQAGTTTIQTVDTLAYPDPVQGEILLNWPGVHRIATPDDPIQYYHQGDQVIPAGLKGVGSMDIPEWAKFISGTDLGTTYTALDISILDGEFDINPTFSVNGNGNIEIFKDGLFVITMVAGTAVQINVDTVHLLQVKKISGETPKGFGPNTWDVGHFSQSIVRLNALTPTQDAVHAPMPEYLDFMYLASGAFGPGTLGPSELEISAFYEEDEIGVAHPSAVHYGFIMRVGNPFG